MILTVFSTMYEDLIWFFIILITSLVISNLLFRRDLGPFNTLRNILGFFGVIIHEISHFIMCKLVNVPTDGIHVRYRYRGQVSLRGSVSIKEIQRVTFLQAALVALAPLFISTWLIFWLLSSLFTLSLEPLFFILGFFMCISLLLGAAPSNQDFKQISRSIKRDPSYSLYQFTLALISGIIVWMIIIFYPIALEITFIYYFLIGVFYFILKYSLHGISRYLMHVKMISRNNDLNYKTFTRKRVKPIKSYKLGIEEAQW
jgi:hypothetical protein